MYPRAFILPQRARRMAGWAGWAGWLAGLRKFARRTAGKGCGCNFFVFSRADNSNWAVARGEGAYLPGAYETLEISRCRDLNVAYNFFFFFRYQYGPIYFYAARAFRTTRAHRRNKQISAIDSSARYRLAENRPTQNSFPITPHR